LVTFTIGLSGWQCWASGIGADVPWRKWISGDVQPAPGDAPALKEVKPVHRRRLSPIGRAAYFCATQCVADAKPVATVFCSAHGEGSRALELLEAIAKGEALSPNSFSLSVHNSVAGLFSIFNHETAPSVTIAAGLDGLGAAFAEGQGLLQEHRGGEVLVVLYDDQMPEPFAVGEDAPRGPIAAAFLLSSRDGVSRYRLERTTSSAAAPAPHWGEIRSLVDFLQQRAARLVLRSDRVEWVWTAL
jgi:hypothetical protein